MLIILQSKGNRFLYYIFTLGDSLKLVSGAQVIYHSRKI